MAIATAIEVPPEGIARTIPPTTTPVVVITVEAMSA
jgi:hypothetical protein